MPIRFHNTLTRRIEQFTPQVPGEVRMYNCGPTVYSSPHIGNFRSFLLADLLRRFLEWRGFRVTQVMNLTDVGHLLEDQEEGEDKLEAAAKKAKLTAWELAEHYIDEFRSALATLSFRDAHVYPRATTHIPEMIAMVETLVAKGLAYAVPSGNVYYDVARFPAYGRLSGNTADALQAGARVEVNPEKRDPRDFALWKIDPKHQMQWDSPWGRGFPGWHIECSAMSRKYLGDTLDLHTGGEDNVFPHHECEIAQSEGATGRPFVRHWLHVRHLLVDGTKMAKRLGNFHTIEDLRKRGYSGDAIRIALQKAHYREPLNFTFAGLDEAEKKAARYRDLRQRLPAASAAADGATAAGTETTATCTRLRERFGAALDDDLNVSVAFAVLDEAVTEANRRAPKGVEAAPWRTLLGEMWEVLGLLENEPECCGSGRTALPTPGAASGSGAVGSPPRAGVPPQVLTLLRQRRDARREKAFGRADALRGEILRSGYREVKDAGADVVLIADDHSTIKVTAQELDLPGPSAV